MKTVHTLLHIQLIFLLIPLTLQSADKVFTQEIDATSKDLFYNKSTEQFESPYTLCTLNNAILQQQHVPIEQKAFGHLCTSALERIKETRQCYTFKPTDPCIYVTDTAEEIATKKRVCTQNVLCIDSIAYAFHKISTLNDHCYIDITGIKRSMNVANGIVNAPEYDILMLLSWTKGISRISDTTELILNGTNNEKLNLDSMPLLHSIVNKYRSQEYHGKYSSCT
jgi:hypothetical protein